MKRILSVTGTRADYGIYRPIYRALRDSGRAELELVVVGMHLRPEFGETVKDIRADGFTIAAELDTLTTEDTPEALARYAARTFTECVDVFAKEKPDLVLLLGDRSEMLAAAKAAYELGIPIAHLHGGETTGSLDESRRHAITQLARIHLTTAEEHAAYIRKIKPREDEKNIHTIGAPALDVILSIKPQPKKELLASVKQFDAALPLILMVQHPDNDEKIEPLAQLEPTLAALHKVETNILIIGSNADAGGVRFNEKLQEFAKKHPHTAFKISLPHEEFLSWEAAADVLVGNSSSGVIEAASFHIPAVNIGNRQQGRLRSGNVIDVSYEEKAISAAIEHALYDATFKKLIANVKNVYWHGGAAQKAVAILTA